MKLVLVYHTGTDSYRLPFLKYQNLLTLRSGPGARYGAHFRTSRTIWGMLVQSICFWKWRIAKYWFFLLVKWKCLLLFTRASDLKHKNRNKWYIVLCGSGAISPWSCTQIQKLLTLNVCTVLLFLLCFNPDDPIEGGISFNCIPSRCWESLSVLFFTRTSDSKTQKPKIIDILYYTALLAYFVFSLMAQAKKAPLLAAFHRDVEYHY